MMFPQRTPITTIARLFFAFAILSALILLTKASTQAQTSLDVPCDQRPTTVSIPTADTRLFCLERVIGLNNADEMAFTGLAMLPDARLFTVSPYEGTLIELVDTDDNGLPDTSEVRAEGLERPIALAAYEDSLYIAGGSTIYRWTEADGVEAIVENLPSGDGYWNGGLTVGGEGDDARLYVGVGARCDFCEAAVEDTERGVILSFALDGTDRQLIATGFRQPSGLTWVQESLWVTDIAPADLDQGQHDELNRVNLTIEPSDYGAPFCNSQSEQLQNGIDCSGTVAPVLTFPSGSVPIGIANYQGEVFPSFTDQLVVGFSGTASASRMRGYSIELFAFADEGSTQLTLVPALPDRDQQYGGVGFYPHHIYGLAISPEGWIYFSVGGGSIYVIRPA